MTRARLQRLLPSLAAALIALVAAFLFVHTAVLRRQRADALRSSSYGTSSDTSSTRGSGRTPSSHVPPSTTREQLISRRVSAVLAIAHPLDRRRALLALLPELEADDFPLALEGFDALNNHRFDPAYGVILDEWIRRDPAAALEYSSKDPMHVSHILELWAASDGPGALRWALEKPEERTRYLRELVPRIIQRDPSQLASLMPQLPGKLRTEAVHLLAQFNDPQILAAAGQWAQSLSDPAERLEAITALCSSPKRQIAAAQFDLLTQYPEAFAHTDFPQLFDLWIRDDPAAAHNALDRISDPSIHQRAFASLVPELIKLRQPDLAADVMDRFPREIDDAVLSSCATASHTFDHAASLEYATRISDPFLREQAEVETLRHWAEDDKAGAQAWSEVHHLPASTRAKIAAP